MRALRRWWRRRSSNSISFGNPLFLKEPGGHEVCGAAVGQSCGVGGGAVGQRCGAAVGWEA